MLPRRQSIVTQGSVGIALQFSDISQVIQSERVLRIQQVGPIEELFRFFLMPALELGNTLAV